MKSMKNLKEAPPTAVDTMINAYPLFTVLAHGIIARPFISFMVDSLG